MGGMSEHEMDMKGGKHDCTQDVLARGGIERWISRGKNKKRADAVLHLPFVFLW